MWNNRKEQYKFKREQERLRKQYTELGVTEEQIQALYDLDRRELNFRRREVSHYAETNGELYDDLQVKYDLVKPDIDLMFLHRFSWMDELQDERIADSIHKLQDKDKELLTKYVIDGYKWREVAEMEDISPQSVARRLAKIRKRLNKYNERTQSN